MLTTVLEAVAEDAAIRAQVELQPAGGPGSKVFPPTYSGQDNNWAYSTEKRRLEDGNVRECVLLDSVQSQANRMENAILEATEAGKISLPVIQTDLSDAADDVGVVTVFDAPHRIADALFRESNHNGTPFRKTEYGQALVESSMDDASDLYRVCPTALLFGVWDSTGERGGSGTKFPRAITSEIVGVGIERGLNPGGRVSPVDISGTDERLYKTESGQLTHDEDEAVDPGDPLSPSDANLGNVTPSPYDKYGNKEPGGVTMDYAELTAVISLSGLRRLSFGNGAHDSEREDVARATLAALGLLGIAEQFKFGYALRSRCNLVPQDDLTFELVRRNGDVVQLELSPTDCVDLFNQLQAEAAEYDLDWAFDRLSLEPTDGLVREIELSRNQITE